MTPEEKKKVKIVVVDDSDFSRKSLIEILDTEGFQVIGEASDAASAFQIAMSTDANLFIIDVVMPDVSGIELAKSISEQNDKARIIMTSSLQMENIIIESISNGASDFIQKPFDKNILIRSVEKICADFAEESERQS